MKKCTGKTDAKGYPEVNKGDTVKNCVTGNTYIVAEKDNLINLETGTYFRFGSLWGDSPESAWTKIECCFKEV